MRESEISRPIPIRAATMSDLHDVRAFLEPFVRERAILPRSDTELARLIEHGFVAAASDAVVGFAAVEPYSRKLAELQCLAVEKNYRRRGIGRRLIQHCVQRARELGVYELMAITASEEPFRDCGFDYSLPEQKRALFVHPQEMPPPELDHG
ncbi:MAG TPA: GNAT family N-acetyltransferase [Pirellulaceae bacterium]